MRERGHELIGVRIDQFDQPKPVLNVGRDHGWRLSGHLLAFELISVHLVVVLVGAAYLARAKRRVESPFSGRRHVGTRTASSRRAGGC